jgi:hypothetical protein
MRRLMTLLLLSWRNRQRRVRFAAGRCLRRCLAATAGRRCIAQGRRLR